MAEKKKQHRFSNVKEYKGIKKGDNIQVVGINTDNFKINLNAPDNEFIKNLQQLVGQILLVEELFKSNRTNKIYVKLNTESLTEEPSTVFLVEEEIDIIKVVEVTE